MTAVIVLLSIVILLLAAIITMMVTGWPGRDRAGIDSAAQSLRREMAEHRTESILQLNVMRVKLEDSVKESIEREMAGYGNKGRSRLSRGKASRVPLIPQASAMQQGVEDEPYDEPTSESILASRQLPLFGAAVTPAPAPGPAPRPVPATEPEPELQPETIFVGYIDDIPDVD
jgi:hypothetical protein